jgi:iron complex transport system ATP-binding protein
MPVISLADAGFKYGEKIILRNITLETRPGEFLTVIGPNGSGKSTLLKGMCGLLRPFSGSVQLDGRPMGSSSRTYIARNVALVPQGAFLPELFTAIEIVLMGRTPHLPLWGGESRRDREIAAQALRRARVAELAGRRVGELSGGEQQRVLLARALTQSTPILLLDEPTSNLDLHYQVSFMEMVRSLAKQDHLAVLVALHDLNLAARYADRVALMVLGKIEAAGTPRQVLTPELISAAYHLPVQVVPHPFADAPLVLPGNK